MTGRPRTLLLRRSPRFRQLSDAAVSGVLELLVVDGSFHPGVAERHSRSTELRAPGFVSERAQGPLPLWPTRRRLCGFPAPRSRRAISPCASRDRALSHVGHVARQTLIDLGRRPPKRTASADPSVVRSSRSRPQRRASASSSARSVSQAMSVRSTRSPARAIGPCPGVHSHDQRVVHGRERLQALDA